MENNCHIKLTHICYCKVLVNGPTNVSVVSVSHLIPCYKVFWESNSGLADQGILKDAAGPLGHYLFSSSHHWIIP